MSEKAEGKVETSSSVQGKAERMDGPPSPKRIKLMDNVNDMKKMNRDLLLSKFQEQDKYINHLEEKVNQTSNAGELTSLRESEEKLKLQQQESTRRENVLVMRLATKEQEMQELLTQIHDLKQAQNPAGSQLRSTLLDPAVNVVFQRMKSELDETKDKLEQAQNDLSAWKFTPDSVTGKKLMAKCRMLIQENKELGKQLSQGRVAQLEAELALQKKYSEELKTSEAELNEFVIQLDEEVEGMQSTILTLQQQLKGVKTELVEEKQSSEKHVEQIRVLERNLDLARTQPPSPVEGGKPPTVEDMQYDTTDRTEAETENQESGHEAMESESSNEEPGEDNMKHEDKDSKFQNVEPELDNVTPDVENVSSGYNNVYSDAENVQFDVRNVQQPEVRNVQQPEVRNVQQFDIRNVQQPEIRNVQQPEIRNVQQPEIRNVQQPEIRNVPQFDVRNVQQPEIRNVQQPEIRNVPQFDVRNVQQPEIRNVQEPEVTNVPQFDVRNVQQPEIRNVQEPEVTNMQQFDVRNVQQPEIRNVQQPEVTNVQQPEIRNVQQPEVTNVPKFDVRNVQQPEIRNVQEPEVTNVPQFDVRNVQQPEIRNVQQPEVTNVPQFDVRNVQQFEVRNVLPEVRNVLPEVRNVLPEVRNVLPEVRNVITEANNVSSEVKNASPKENEKIEPNLRKTASTPPCSAFSISQILGGEPRRTPSPDIPPGGDAVVTKIPYIGGFSDPTGDTLRTEGSGILNGDGKDGTPPIVT
ncbi:Pre-mRNA-splicing regulator WTAP [Paramuricea clavata]|uniref:Pre-mRNA-splicing regulator WTAP n=1 Tax=Paramuricea clavata TaxID=317549 RepID=A0A6S7FRZ4_PARCT|nr:Pre-mRNA-splicing regulator WTAP [Paramuricea clavata]